MRLHCEYTKQSNAVAPTDFYIRFFMYNPDKHHRRSIRINGYDYSQAGLYYITICAKDRQYIFGGIIDKAMFLNDIGKIATQCWHEIPLHFPDTVLHEHVVMPNHLHGIIEIASSGKYQPSKARFQNQGKNTLSSIVGSYKSTVSKQAHETGFAGSVWQRNYHEHIIRDKRSYQRIARYIIDNPPNWHEDEFYI